MICVTEDYCINNLNGYSFQSVCYEDCPTGSWKTANNSDSGNGTCISCNPPCSSMVDINLFKKEFYSSFS